MNVSVAQLGARMHFAVPRSLEQRGMLACLFTDFSAAKGWLRPLQLFPRCVRPAGLQRLLSRKPEGVPRSKTTAFSRFGLDYSMRLRRASTGEERDKAFLWAGNEFARRIIKKGLGNATAIYSFNTASLELFEFARKAEIRCILEQTITPRKIEEQLMDQERDTFPAWEPPKFSKYAKELADRELREWELADWILCASEYVKDGIVACGGAPEKCLIVPYGVDMAGKNDEGRESRDGKPEAGDLRPEHKNEQGTKNEGQRTRNMQPAAALRVLTVGAVGLRKGSPYLLAAAKRMRGIAEFRIAGAVHASSEAAAELREHIDLVGIIPRSGMAEQYAWADVFLLPSLCEGSATSTYEALAYGLPVITTPNTGSVARDGMEGFIVPARDPDAIVEKLTLLARDREVLARLSENARQLSKEFTLQKYGDRLIEALRSHGVV